MYVMILTIFRAFVTSKFVEHYQSCISLQCDSSLTIETEKYAHVTFFFNGGLEKAFSQEDRLMVPSPKVPTYDLQPEMSADGVGKSVSTCISRFGGFILYCYIETSSELRKRLGEVLVTEVQHCTSILLFKKNGVVECFP